MALSINTNIPALNAYRNLNTTTNDMSKSLEKLSSGFRINRAADDAAGLAISEGMRSQIGGIKMGVRNAQDGISVVQTAEGALNEVHSMLNRMRDLSVQAANSGSNDSAARSAAQAEIDALKSEVTRVSDKTKFGGQSLLDGSYGVQLRLHPEDLGAVQVNVDVRHGEISIRLHATNEAARDALRSGLSDLRQQLEDQGLRAGSMEVGSGGANAQQRETSWSRSQHVEVPRGDPTLSDQPVTTAAAAPSSVLDLRM